MRSSFLVSSRVQRPNYAESAFPALQVDMLEGSEAKVPEFFLFLILFPHI